MRGANGLTSVLGSAIGLGHRIKNAQPGVPRLAKGSLYHVKPDALNLHVELDGGDPLAGAGDLKVHVADVVLLALYVGQGQPSIRFPGYQSDRYACNRSPDGDARVH